MHVKNDLRSFFIALKDFYGPDVMNMGCCSTRIIAFSFESYLGRVRKWLQTPNRPLSQLCRRFHKQKFLKKKRPTLPLALQILEGEESNVSKIEFEEVTISNTSPDNMILLEDDTIVMIN